jgi:predicted DNA-binding transcriptional regulator AlpA
MQSENDVPRLLRFKDLQERGIAMTHQAVRHMQIHENFPMGRLLGPNSRVWTVAEVNEWLASRPTEQSRQTKEKTKKSVEARKTARQLLESNTGGRRHERRS